MQAKLKYVEEKLNVILKITRGNKEREKKIDKKLKNRWGIKKNFNITTDVISHVKKESELMLWTSLTARMRERLHCEGRKKVLNQYNVCVCEGERQNEIQCHNLDFSSTPLELLGLYLGLFFAHTKNTCFCAHCVIFSKKKCKRRKSHFNPNNCGMKFIIAWWNT